MNGSKGKGRFALYGTAAVTASALLWAGFVRKVDADPGTLVRSAQITLDSVRQMPRRWKNGPNELRAKMLSRAEDQLHAAERQVREALKNGGGEERWQGEDLACILEFLGYARLLADDREGALDFYRQALEQEGCSKERRRSLTFALARIQLDRSRPALARRRLHSMDPSTLPGGERAKWYLLLGESLLAEKAPRKKVADCLALALEAGGPDPEVQEACGLYYERAGMTREGARLLECAGKRRPSALLHLAELKLREGDVETATSVLQVLGERSPGLLEEALERKEFQEIARDPRLNPRKEGKTKEGKTRGE